jgi:hypothetical protein
MSLPTSIPAPDLTRDFPRSPNELLGGYVILARTIDKCRADLAGTAGDYHWNCGLAKMFFEFKGIAPHAFQEQVKAGKTDEEILEWVNQTGHVHTEEEILAWCYDCRSAVPFTPEMKAYVEETVRSLTVKNPYIFTFFQMLDAEEGRL